MSRVVKNLLTSGLSGMIGGMLVFRKVGTRTIVSSSPSKSTRPPSTGQLSQRERFAAASRYAKAQLADPQTRALYEELAAEREFQSAYNVAMADFLKGPQVLEVDLSAYTGAVNDGIRVRATDHVRVLSVKLEIYSSTGVLVESGLALVQSNGLDWLYKATVANPGFAGGKVLVSAYDLPGNSSNAEQEF